jgi:hypothetical protein
MDLDPASHMSSGKDLRNHILNPETDPCEDSFTG